MTANIRVKKDWEDQVIAARRALDALLESENNFEVRINGVALPLNDMSTSELWPIFYRIACEVVADGVELEA